MQAQLDQPKGVIPSQNGCPIGADYAQVAENIDLTRRGWVPWREPRPVHDFKEAVRSGHVRECCYHGVPVADAHYLDAGVPSRTYLTARGEYPVVADDFCADRWVRVGYPRPDLPNVVVQDHGGPDGPFTFPTQYKIAYANDCDEVGPGSKPTPPTKLNPKGVVHVQLPQKPAKEWHATHVVIYRLVPVWDTGEGYFDLQEGSLNAPIAGPGVEAEYFEVGRVPIGTQSFTDRGTFLGPALVTDDLLAPQKGLIITGETSFGSIVGFCGREVWFSERNAYWGFPPRARHQFPDNVCHLVVCQDRVIVVTETRVYVLVDDADCRDSMNRTVVEGKQTFHCCGRDSYVQLANGVLYTTLEGLVLADVEASARVVSGRAFERDDWRALAPNSTHLGSGHGHLFLSTHRGTFVWPLVFDEQGLLPEYLSTLSFTPDRWFNDEHGELYFLQHNSLYHFNEGDEFMQMDWHQADQRLRARTRVSTLRGDYRDKKDKHGNRITMYRNQRQIKHTDRANQTIRMRSTLGDCFSVRIEGREPMCGVYYGAGKTNITQRPS